MDATLTIEGLSAGYTRDRAVLRDVNLALGPGLNVLLGVNGAGKTALMKTLLGLIRPLGGSIEYDGEPLESMTPRRRARRVAYVPQYTREPPRCDVLSFVLTGANPYLGIAQTPDGAWRRRAREALEALDVGALENRGMDSLSGGETRMAYLARATLQDTRFLMLDEPEAGLDFARAHQFLQTLRRHCARRSVCALAALHDPGLALRYAKTVVLLKDGAVLMAAEPSARCLEAGVRALYGDSAAVFEGAGGLTVDWIAPPARAPQEN